MDWSPDRIREAREARGWTQDQLAQAIDSSLRAVVAWEAGDNRVSRRFAVALDRELGPDRAIPPPPRPPTLPEIGSAELVAELARRLTELDQLRGLFQRGDPRDLHDRPDLIHGTPHPDNHSQTEG